MYAQLCTKLPRLTKRSAADFAAVQEVKLPKGPLAAAAEQAGRTCGWTTRIAGCNVSASQGRSAGVAVSARSHIGMAAVDDDLIDRSIAARLMLCKLGAICRGGIAFGSVYLYHTVGPTAACNLDALHHIAAAVQSLRMPWIVAGDWQ